MIFSFLNMAKGGLLLFLMPFILLFTSNATMPKVLVFSKTAGFRHESIPAGIEAIKKLGAANGFEVVSSEDPSIFNQDDLSMFKSVVFLSTTGDILNKSQQNEFERYIQAGGSFMGIHAATDTEYNWPWYNGLVGAYFSGHPQNPNVRTADFYTKDRNHPSMTGVPDRFKVVDEFYNFKSIKQDLIKVLINIDESTYEGGTNGAEHPMSWYHDYDGGKAFYTGMGHTNEMFENEIFLAHLKGAFKYLLDGSALDYSKSKTKSLPEANRFAKVVLANELDEPVELAVLPNEKVLLIERKGAVKLYDPNSNTTKLIYTVDVSHKYKNKDNGRDEAEDGLMGLAIDPLFKETGWIYMYHSLAGEKPVNVLTRWDFKDEKLDPASMKIILEVAVQRDYCCHTGGSIAFDNKGNLYVSTGDNTSPRATAYAPLDERPDRFPFDSQKGSANTNDLRGKVLRITPQVDGTYKIPAGNLFAPGTEKTRPEIYGMGMRNPYRISVDQKNGYVYWGDVGPDASRDSAGLGPNGYDEINQLRKPGYFGWPYFIADNQAYYDYNFDTKTSGPRFDPMKPINNSPNNTGLQQLPPAQPAFIYYTYGASEKFPLVGTGGRTAMAGPVYYADQFKNAARPFPDYYDGKLFIYEWMRGWVIAVQMDAKGDYQDMETFIPGIPLSNPMDMEFGPNGDLYVLEYGTGWFQKNENSSLSKIQYTAGNRKPLVKLTADKTKGAIPMKVNFSSDGTEDYDNDSLSYVWKVFDKNGVLITQSKQKNPAFNFIKLGTYKTELTVTDKKGAKNSLSQEILAGNEPPKIEIDLAGANTSFFFPDKAINYQVKVKDLEDGAIHDEDVAMTIDFLKEGHDKIEVAQGHVAADEYVKFAEGKRLLDAADCKSCHKVSQKSVGPNYVEVARKYKDLAEGKAHISQKIIKGGSGVWGDVVMAAHPTITNEDASKIAEYILSLADEQINLPLQGSYAVASKDMIAGQGSVVLRASYTDKGANGIGSLNSQKILILNNPIIKASTASEVVKLTQRSFGGNSLIIAEKEGGYIGFDPIDLTGVKSIAFNAFGPKQMGYLGGYLELRLDSVKGPILGKSALIEPAERRPGAGQTAFTSVNIPETKGKHKLYVLFKNDNTPTASLFFISEMKLEQ